MLVINVYNAPSVGTNNPQLTEHLLDFEYHLKYAASRFRALGVCRADVLVVFHPRLPTEISVSGIFIKVEGHVKNANAANGSRKKLAAALVRVVQKDLSHSIEVECKVARFEEDDEGFASSYLAWKSKRFGV